MALLLPPGERITSRNDIPADSGRLYVYRNRTTTLADLYSDPDLSIALGNPVTFGSGGLLPVNVYVGQDRFTLRAERFDTSELWTRNDCFGWSEISGLSFNTTAEATAATLTDGATVYIKGRGRFFYDASSTATSNNATVLTPNNGAGRLIIDSSIEVTVKTFGATGDGVTDDTAAIQAAIDYFATGGEIIFPYGVYLLTSTLTLSVSGQKLIGQGAILKRTDGGYGDTILVSAPDPATTRLQNMAVIGFRMDCDAKMTVGSHLSVKDVISSTFSHLHLWNAKVSMNFEGVQNTVVDDTKIDTGAYYTSGIEAGTAFVNIRDANNTANETGELFFSNFNWTHTINANIERGVYIRAGDGVWFDNGHIFGAQTICQISPQTTTTQCQGLHFTQVWFDQLCTRNLYISSTSTTGFGDITFSNCKFYGGSLQNIEITTGANNLSDISFDGCLIGESAAAGVLVGDGDKVHFNGCQIKDGNSAGAANVIALVVNADVQNFSWQGGFIGTQSAVNVYAKGIVFSDISADANVSGVHFENVADEINLAGSIVDGGKITGITTARADYQDVEAAVVLAVPAVCETVDLTGASVTITDIEYGWDGRKVLLRAKDNSQTIDHGAGSSGTNVYTNTGSSVAIAVNRTVLLTYSAAASAWYQSL